MHPNRLLSIGNVFPGSTREGSLKLCGFREKGSPGCFHVNRYAVAITPGIWLFAAGDPNATQFQHVRSAEMLLPLPGGEGRGEGGSTSQSVGGCRTSKLSQRRGDGQTRGTDGREQAADHSDQHGPHSALDE